ncbi:hypothetical protein C2845_PM10G10520 [Panicum miliaceum]|uniref:Uncharacterized protein n=1 Tax=Panicum miliaceum TaxID=4540 RepID=A0A3L6PII8_PANMI|nr:hypothetical protein C2845_PM10G10520 [Panicum miliaceum]
MARTYQTARKRTGGRQVRIAPVELAPPAPVPAPVEEVEAMEEEPAEAYYFVDGDDGRIMAVDEEGNQFTPPASPVVEAPPPPLVVPAPAPAPALVTAGGSPGNSVGIDDGGDDDEDNDNNDNNDDQGDDPPRTRQLCCVRTSDRELGHLSLVLQGVLQELGNHVNPHYHTHHYIDPALGDYYLTRVHVSAMPHATYDASVSNAARRALWSICHTHRQELQNTEYRHLPRRLSGTPRQFLAGALSPPATMVRRSTAAARPSRDPHHLRRAALSLPGLIRASTEPRSTGFEENSEEEDFDDFEEF